MKQRILYGWSLTRFIYLLLGGMLIAHSIVENQWWGVAMGGYFASMATFNFGCASAGCPGNNCSTPQHKTNSVTKDSLIEFEEIKNN